jgi:2-keto-4-pentenoate hydratase/2-oxohepta-3-ene-1,7-dioic acid hydratase in catechol pathway
MKLVSYVRNKEPSWGIVSDDGAGVVDCAGKFGRKYPDLKALIAGRGLAEAKKCAKGRKPDAKLAALKLLPPIGNPDKILCVGLNYKTHIAETGRSDSPYPTWFTRFANTQVGHGAALVRPKVSDKFDYEGELALVIGKRGRHIAKEKALQHVAAYSCYNDGSVRDWQRHTTQFTPGKNFVGTGGFGPWLVTADEIPDPATMRLVTRLNGQVMQDATTDLLVFDIPTLINYASTFTELVPGDVIVTGTPGGVGFARNPQVFMKAGDTVEVEISKIGTLVNTIADEK